ncbi:AraC family transcriptional regulator [Thiomicrorhabdus sp.]|uniref:AraC family transcriptional regulator n=1 Tax=Thiomicrorhabdus sp. TaxID=2039724 RepID=UPI0029C79FF8|nr:AraC family transcriptional regulator [Thiomicrorhabdus sp.]
MKHLTLTDTDLQELFLADLACDCNLIDQSFCRMKMHSEKIDDRIFYMHSQIRTRQALRIKMHSDFFSGFLGIHFHLNGTSINYLEGWSTPLPATGQQIVISYAPIAAGFSDFNPHCTVTSSGIFLDCTLLLQLLENDPRPQVNRLFAPIFEQPDQAYTLVTTMTPSILQLVSELQNQSRIGLFNGFSRRGKMYELLQQVVEQVIKEKCSASSEIKLGINDVMKLEQVKQLLKNDIQSPPSLTQLAKLVGLNEFKLKRGFKQLNQQTVFEYLHQLRMQHAASLLCKTHQPVVEIAQQSGYCNHGHFSSAFRQFYGKAPTAFRKTCH